MTDHLQISLLKLGSQKTRCTTIEQQLHNNNFMKGNKVSHNKQTIARSNNCCAALVAGVQKNPI